MASSDPQSTPGKSIVVTGGLSGIGLAIVHYYASSTPSSPTSQTTISILDITPLTISPSPPPSPTSLPTASSTATSTFTSLQSKYPSITFNHHKCDISNWDEQSSVFKEVYRRVGRVDVVCANAGVTEMGSFLEDGEDGEVKKPNLKTLDVNLVGTLYTIKLATHYMRRSESTSKGLIICTASNAGIYPFPIAPLYAMSKHAVVGAVRSLARPLAEGKGKGAMEKERRGVRICGVAPNCIETGLADENLFAHMKLTPMSTLISAVDAFTRDEGMNGVVAEISGERFTVREPPVWVDEMSRENLEAFWRLGYA